MSTLDDIRAKFVIDKKVPKEVEVNIPVKNENNINIELNKLIPFRQGQPFSYYDENKMEEMKESIRINGVIYPIIVRKIENDMYEIISGHNRVECSKMLGLSTIPAQIVDCDDDRASLIMLDTNLCNREKILPVEKGYAYKRKNEILKRLEDISIFKWLSDNSPMETEDSKAQVYRFMRLTELIKPLQEKVNKEDIPIRAGVELSFLSKEEQEIVNTVIEEENIKINQIQAEKIRDKKNEIDYKTVLKILRKEKIKVEKFTGKLEKRAIKIYKHKFKNDKEFTDLIISLLEKYFGIDS